jgi:hypothetical protein
MGPVADWWLEMVRVVAGETEAAAAPTKTIVRAKMRRASFIVGNLSWIWMAGDGLPDCR